MPVKKILFNQFHSPSSTCCLIVVVCLKRRNYLLFPPPLKLYIYYLFIYFLSTVMLSPFPRVNIAYDAFSSIRVKVWIWPTRPHGSLLNTCVCPYQIVCFKLVWSNILCSYKGIISANEGEPEPLSCLTAHTWKGGSVQRRCKVKLGNVRKLISLLLLPCQVFFDLREGRQRYTEMCSENNFHTIIAA